MYLLFHFWFFWFTDLWIFMAMIKVLFILIFQLLYIFNLFYFWLEETMFDVYTLLILFQTKKNLKIIFRASRKIKTMDPQSFQFSRLLWFRNSFHGLENLTKCVKHILWNHIKQLHTSKSLAEMILEKKIHIDQPVSIPSILSHLHLKTKIMLGY